MRRPSVWAAVAVALACAVPLPVLSQDTGATLTEAQAGDVAAGPGGGDGGGALDQLPAADAAEGDAGAPPAAPVGFIAAPEGEGAMTSAAAGDMALLPEGATIGAPIGTTGAAAPARGLAGMPPVVVELFTAQGCSSCPPADALVATLAGRDDVLPLAWHVDYWDYLGWADAFARPEHTARQEAYAEAAGERGVYTPQIIVDGQDTMISAQRGTLLALIQDHAARPPAISATARAEGSRFVLDLMPRAAVPGGVMVTLVRYAANRRVTIKAGENRGRTMEYVNIVLGSETVAHWDARAPLRLTVSPGGPDARFPADTRHAILAQQALGSGRPGPILAAVRLD